MTTRRPLVLDAALLERLLPRHDWDALIGDLHEEYQRDRSRPWYFAQILAAIVVASLKDSRTHWALALRSIVIGVAAFVAYFQVVGIWTLNNARGLIPLGYVGASLLPWLFFLTGFALSGWVIGRFHRAYGITLVIPFAALMSVLGLTDLVRSAIFSQSWTLWLLLKPLAIPGAILLGGYWAANRVEAT